MPYQTGIVSTFANKLITTDETIGTGNGSQTAFSYTVSKPTIFVDSIKIKYTIAAVQYTATSNGSGAITGTSLTGTVNQAGAISLTFSVAPDNATLVFVDEYKTKGLLQVLMDFCCAPRVTDTLGTGNGSQTVFNKTLASTPISKGQCRVRFKIASVVYDVWDNGEGTFEHSKIDLAGTSINYATGSMTVEFNDPIDNTYAMEILYNSSATEGRDWIAMLQQNTKNSSNADAFSGLLLQEAVLKNSGLSYKEFIGVGMREFQLVSSSAWNWNLNLYKRYNDVDEAQNKWNVNSFFTGKTAYDSTWNNFSQHPIMTLRDDTLKYWIISSKRRIIVIAQVIGTVYVSCYLGGARRFASPNNYPIPNIIIGNGEANRTYSSTDLVSIAHQSTGLGNVSFGIGTLGQHVASSNMQFVPTENDYVDTGIMKKQTNNQILLFPLYGIYEPGGAGSKELLWELDGVYHCPSNALTVEDTITQSGNTYLVVQNIQRTTYKDYFCVLLS